MAELGQTAQAVQELLEQASRLEEAVHVVNYGSDPSLREGRIEPDEMADIGFLFRELENKLDELRKEAKARKDLCGRLIALHVTREATLDDRHAGNVKGLLCTAIPDVQMRPKLPRRGTPEYAKLCRYFGLSEAAIERGLFAPHWVHLSELLTEQAAAGERPPEGLVGLEPDPQCTFRRRQRKS